MAKFDFPIESLGKLDLSTIGEIAPQGDRSTIEAIIFARSNNESHTTAQKSQKNSTHR